MQLIMLSSTSNLTISLGIAKLQEMCIRDRCMTAHCMAVNMTKVKEVGADKYIDTDKHTWSTEGLSLIHI